MAVATEELKLNTEREEEGSKLFDETVRCRTLEGAPRRVSLYKAPMDRASLTRLATPFHGIWQAAHKLFGGGDDAVSLAGPQNGCLLPPEVAKAPNEADSFVTLAELEKLNQENPGEYVVHGLLPGADVHVAVGDSGLGKTAWAYQLGLCVATGKPFLGHDVKPVRVLYYDLENGREQILGLGHSICKYLEIGDAFPPAFLVLKDDGNRPSLEKAIEKYKPGLVLVDTLRALRSDVEEKNNLMGGFLQATRNLGRANNCAILFLHYVRKPGPAKPGEDGGPWLQATSTLEWLREAAGARALINQTTTRIAFDRPHGFKANDAALVMRYFVKVKGESEPVYLERVFNDDGEPVGYRSMVGDDLLEDEGLKKTFNNLPREEFSFKEAKRIYGRTDDPTKKFLRKCEAAGLVRQVRRGVYKRIDGKKG